VGPNTKFVPEQPTHSGIEGGTISAKSFICFGDIVTMFLLTHVGCWTWSIIGPHNALNHHCSLQPLINSSFVQLNCFGVYVMHKKHYTLCSELRINCDKTMKVSKNNMK